MVLSSECLVATIYYLEVRAYYCAVSRNYLADKISCAHAHKRSLRQVF